MVDSKKVLVLTNVGKGKREGKENLCFTVISCDVDKFISGSTINNDSYNGVPLSIRGYISFSANGKTTSDFLNQMQNGNPVKLILSDYTYKGIKKGRKIIQYTHRTVMVLPLYSLYSILVKFANKHDHENIRIMKKRIAEVLASEDFKNLFGTIKE